MSFEMESFVIQGVEFPPLGEWAYVPVIPENFMLLKIDQDALWEIVGESKYNDNIRPIRDAYLESGEQENGLLALLVHEPKNPFDRHAVRVDLFVADTETGGLMMGTAGYLPRERAYEFFEPVRRSYEKGLLPLTSVQIFGGTVDKPNFGVWLGGGNARVNAPEG